jgi:hypothetical protein
MEAAVAVVVFVVSIAAWNFFLYKRSGGRMWNPFSMALTATATAILFVVSGSIGYTLSRHDRFLAQTPWTDGVIWPQLWVGFAVGALAVLLWRRALRSIRSGSTAPRSD